MTIKPTWLRDKKSLIFLLLLFQFTVGLPLYLVMVLGLFSDGRLTVETAVILALYCVFGAIVVALLFWVTFVVPMRRKIEAKKTKDITHHS